MKVWYNIVKTDKLINNNIYYSRKYCFKFINNLCTNIEITYIQYEYNITTPIAEKVG